MWHVFCFCFWFFFFFFVVFFLFFVFLILFSYFLFYDDFNCNWHTFFMCFRFTTLKIFLLQSNDVARAFPGGRAAHPEDLRKKVKKEWGKNKRTYRKIRKNWGNVLIMPTREWEAGYGPASKFIEHTHDLTVVFTLLLTLIDELEPIEIVNLWMSLENVSAVSVTELLMNTLIWIVR